MTGFIPLLKDLMPRKGRLLLLVNNRVEILLKDGRKIYGQFLAFDKFMNSVIADCEEHRGTKTKNTDQGRTLGLVILRGDDIVSIIQHHLQPVKSINISRTPASSIISQT